MAVLLTGASSWLAESSTLKAGPALLQVAPQDVDDAWTLLADLRSADDVGASDDVGHG